MTQTNKNANLQTTLVILCMVMFLLFTFYLILVPLKLIDTSIEITNAMIALMPPDPVEQKTE